MSTLRIKGNKGSTISFQQNKLRENGFIMLLEGLRLENHFNVNGGLRLGDRFYIPLDKLEADVVIDVEDLDNIVKEIKKLQKRKNLDRDEKKRLEALKAARKQGRDYLNKVKQEIILRKQIEGIWNDY